MFFITGTDTEIRKTIITAGIACILKQQGYKTAVYKPVQSGAQKTKDGLISPDLEFVKKISTNITLKSTYNLEAPIAPSVAAEIEKVEILPEKILKDFKSLKRDHNVVLVVDWLQVTNLVIDWQAYTVTVTCDGNTGTHVLHALPTQAVACVELCSIK